MTKECPACGNETLNVNPPIGSCNHCGALFDNIDTSSSSAAAESYGARLREVYEAWKRDIEALSFQVGDCRTVDEISDSELDDAFVWLREQVTSESAP